MTSSNIFDNAGGRENIKGYISNRMLVKVPTNNRHNFIYRGMRFDMKGIILLNK